MDPSVNVFSAAFAAFCGLYFWSLPMHASSIIVHAVTKALPTTTLLVASHLCAAPSIRLSQTAAVAFSRKLWLMEIGILLKYCCMSEDGSLINKAMGYLGFDNFSKNPPGLLSVKLCSNIYISLAFIIINSILFQ